jgi:MFS family permease
MLKKIGPVTLEIAVVPLYAVAFYRISFGITVGVSSIFASITAAGGIFGATFGGRLINRSGRKTLAVISLCISGFCVVLFTFFHIIWLSVFLWTVAATFASMAATGLNGLVMEQVPSFKSSMLSINQTFTSTGTILAVIIGGTVLNLFNNNFQILMTILGVAGISGGIIVFVLAKDPCARSLVNK